MSRKRFSEREVIETLIRTGHEILCFRTKAPITLDTVKTLEREHLTPIALGGADDPTNCAYSLSEAHKKQTNAGHSVQEPPSELGAVMTMEITWVSIEVSPMEEHRYQKEPGWFEAMRSHAATALAHRILDNDKALFRRIEPTKADLDKNPFVPIKYQWTVALESDLDEIKARERQVEEARRRGREEAAAICLAAADRYHRLTGGCAGVIASALTDAAKTIRES